MPSDYGAQIGVDQARKVASAAIAEGKKNGWTVAAAIVDTGGNQVHFGRIDGTQVDSSDVAGCARPSPPTPSSGRPGR